MPKEKKGEEDEGMKTGCGGLGEDPEAVDEIIAPGAAYGGSMSAPHSDGVFDTMRPRVPRQQPRITPESLAAVAGKEPIELTTEDRLLLEEVFRHQHRHMRTVSGKEVDPGEYVLWLERKGESYMLKKESKPKPPRKPKLQ